MKTIREGKSIFDYLENEEIIDKYRGDCLEIGDTGYVVTLDNYEFLMYEQDETLTRDEYYDQCEALYLVFDTEEDADAFCDYLEKGE